MGASKTYAAIFAASLALLLCQAQTVVNTTAAADVVRLATADPAVLAAANDLITAARNSALTNGLTSLDITTLTSDPKVQAAAVPLIDAAAAAAGPAWLAVVPQAAPVAKDPTAAAQVLKLALADPTVLNAAKGLVTAVQLAVVSNPLSGYSVTALAANPGVQAALVPLVSAAAAASGVEWAAVDTTAVLATVAAAASAPAVASLPAAAQVASFQAALPKLPSLFGRKMQQVILNPGDFLGMPTDASKGTPSASDAARLNAALGLTGQPSAQDTAFQQEQAAARVNDRMSDSATTSTAMQNFDISSLNPTGNNVRATQQFRQQQQPAAAYAAAPTNALAAYAFAPAPYDPSAAPQKVAVMQADGSYQVQNPGASDTTSQYDTSASSNLAAAPTADATQPTSQAIVKPANQVAPSQISQGTVLQRPGATNTAATTTDSAGSSTAAQDILTSLGGGLSDSPGVSPAPQGQAFDWLNPSPNAPPVPTDSVVAQRAAAGATARPPASQDSQNVRNFVSQAGFSTSKSTSSSTATSGAQQGRRLLAAEAQRMSAPSGAQPLAEDASALALRVAQAFGQAATQLLSNPSNPPASAPEVLLVGTALSPTSIAAEQHPRSAAKAPTAAAVPAPAPAPATSMTAEVASAANLAAPIQAGLARGVIDPPKPPLHELVDAAAELPARLGILPALPGMAAAGQAQPASGAAASQLQGTTMFTLPASQGLSAVPAQRGSVSGSGVNGVGRRRLY